MVGFRVDVVIILELSSWLVVSCTLVMLVGSGATGIVGVLLFRFCRSVVEFGYSLDVVDAELV